LLSHLFDSAQRRKLLARDAFNLKSAPPRFTPQRACGHRSTGKSNLRRIFKSKRRIRPDYSPG